MGLVSCQSNVASRVSGTRMPVASNTKSVRSMPPLMLAYNVRARASKSVQQASVQPVMASHGRTNRTQQHAIQVAINPSVANATAGGECTGAVLRIASDEWTNHKNHWLGVGGSQH